MLIALYNSKLEEYKKTGTKESPEKLLAMLLLPQKDSFDPLMVTEGEFYEIYKERIDKEIQKVETDFEFSREELIQLIENKDVCCNDFEEDKIWFVFCEGFGVMHGGIMYHKEKSPEELYQEYFGKEPMLKSFTEQSSLSKEAQKLLLELKSKK